MLGPKGNGKAKGKTAGPERGQGHTLPRTRVTAEKFTGTVISWKGKYGWLQPAEEIEHEKAKLRNGRLFASSDDVMDGSGELHPGAPCEFHIWEDESGLGADEIVETGPPDPSAIPDEETAKKGPKGAPKGASAGGYKAAGAKSWDDKGYGKGSKSGWTDPWGSKGKDSWDCDPWGGYGKGKDSWGADKGYGKGKDTWGEKGKGVIQKGKKGKDGGKGGKSKQGGQGHLLPRTRVSAEKFTGTVAAWKGRYGWLKPAEEIEHEKANNHKGGIFVSKDDIEGGLGELKEGATVEFHIWEDESGLGADEVVQL